MIRVSNELLSDEFPAPAGINRCKVELGAERYGVPRASGDKPPAAPDS
ncbi:hypothetical protein EFER_0294 [Escherichia fergusonii ATCC 35469]|uniref:Uncharacterized protein n=1 Tax=Escherichia fergusonii (strain ATCC 35469 / DSM 13698 / CCUG 18766 / IAM 14443 / JCM 21226 / LMG 7866 / NBRC 102419 / NCTC 12128 / CDC 0568-73) TaxID=585054 RepID=B7LWQ3_ESCF3|nr:hypothetical protein EFER_0294 [Escherichia fergusonii ATCC 35469]